MQTVCGGVKAAVDGQAVCEGCFLQGVASHVLYEAALSEHGHHVRPLLAGGAGGALRLGSCADDICAQGQQNVAVGALLPMLLIRRL